MVSAAKVNAVFNVISLSDRVVNGDKFGAVWKRSFDLHVMDHFSDPRHALRRSNDMCARLHQIRHGAPIARTFDHEIGDQRDGFGVVQLYPPFQTPACDHCRKADQKFVLFPWCQVHTVPLDLPNPRQRPAPECCYCPRDCLAQRGRIRADKPRDAFSIPC